MFYRLGHSNIKPEIGHRVVQALLFMITKATEILSDLHLGEKKKQ